MMRTLKFKCAGQKLTKDGSFTDIAPGSKGYLKAFVDFDNEWSGAVKVVEFYIQGASKDIYPVLVKDGFCMVPDEVTDARTFCMQIVGKKGDQRITTNKVTIRQEG